MKPRPKVLAGFLAGLGVSAFLAIAPQLIDFLDEPEAGLPLWAIGLLTTLINSFVAYMKADQLSKGPVADPDEL